MIIWRRNEEELIPIKYTFSFYLGAINLALVLLLLREMDNGDSIRASAE